jgi:hypothetical protein
MVCRILGIEAYSGIIKLLGEFSKCTKILNVIKRPKSKLILQAKMSFLCIFLDQYGHYDVLLTLGLRW